MTLIQSFAKHVIDKQFLGQNQMVCGAFVASFLILTSRNPEKGTLETFFMLENTV